MFFVLFGLIMGVKILKDLLYFFKMKSKLCIRFVINCFIIVVYVCLKKDNCNWLSFYILLVRIVFFLFDYKYIILCIVIKILFFLFNGIKKFRYICKYKSFVINIIIVEYIYMY